MSRRASRVLIAFLIFALAACSRPPAPDEIATPDEDVIAFVRRHEAAISEEGLPRHQAALEATPPGETLYVLPTYTAMLEIRKTLSEMGYTHPFWEDR